MWRMTRLPLQLGLGAGWRPELALMLERRADLGFVELLAEDFWLERAPPVAVEVLRDRGVTTVVHGVSLSLGSAEPPDRDRLAALARLARRSHAPLVSEHLAFVRAAGIESGHLSPLPRTREALETVVRNVRAAQAVLPVPLALENVATLFEWPDAEMSEADFLGEVLDRTDALLLLDLANLYANARNHGVDAGPYLSRIPLERIAYVHIAGGFTDADGLYHDTHAHAVPAPVLALLHELCARVHPPGVLIERDDRFPPDAVFNAELDAVAAILNGPPPRHSDPGLDPGEEPRPFESSRSLAALGMTIS
jgi:uncharacterized protein (UPF0276 family)